MRSIKVFPMFCALMAVMLAGAASTTQARTMRAGARQSQGFVKLFDGKTLTGWTCSVGGAGPGYVPMNGIFYCPADGGGNLFTTRSTPISFPIRVQAVSRQATTASGYARPSRATPPTWDGVPDPRRQRPMYAHLEPGQYHSSIYKVVPAKRGSLKPVGQWNHEEITAIGRHIKIVVNGMVPSMQT